MLTEKQVLAAKPGEKAHKVFDEKGLYLLVQASGAKLWRQKYRVNGSEKLLAHGSYPEVSLKQARQKRDDARSQLANGLDPGAQRKAAKVAAKVARANTFEGVAEEWFGHYRDKREREHKPLSPATIKKTEWLLNLAAYRTDGSATAPHVLRSLAAKPVSQIQKADVRAVIGGLVRRGKVETAHRMLDRLDRVFRFAIGTERMTHNPAAAYQDSDDPRDELPSLRVRHHPAVTDPRDVGQLLRAIEDYRGQPATEAAMRLAPLVFVRPGELRAAEWSEFDLEGKEPTWRIPATRMKMRRPHVVPLAPQAVAILKRQHDISGPTGLVFPSLTNFRRPLSENAITAALRRMGYSGDQMTWHGFRTIASTLLRELDFASELIELQLAHTDKNETRDAYNRAERLPDRRKMMVAWASYLDKLRDNKVKVAA